jgi:hypothetical protein
MTKIRISLPVVPAGLSPVYFRHSHRQVAIGIFGNTAGLDFGTNPPTPLTNSSMNAFEGCATIADVAGVLQFYTNGNLVLGQKIMFPMPSGNGLNGDGAATQNGYRCSSSSKQF